MKRRWPAMLAGCLFLLTFAPSPCLAEDVDPLGVLPPRPVVAPDLDRGLVGSPWTETRPYWQENLFKRILVGQKFLYTEWWPAELRRPAFSLPALASVAVASGSSGSGIDRTLREAIQRGSERRGQGLSRRFSQLGDTEVAVVLLGGAHLVARWTKSVRMTRTTSLSMEAALQATLQAEILKRVTRRSRPTYGAGEFFVNEPAAGQEINSFPSGHAMGAFAVAAVLASEHRDRRWVGWLAYGTAGLVASSRVALGRHHPSDVFAGALLGRSVGRMVLLRAGEAEPRGARFELRPWFGPENEGIGVMYRRSW